MRLMIPSSILAVTAIVGAFMFGPTRPHDYFAKLRPHAGSFKTGFGRDRDPKTGAWRYFRTQDVDFTGVATKKFEALMGNEDMFCLAQMFNSTERDYYRGDGVSMTYYPFGSGPGSGSANLTQYLQPRELLWVRLTHLGQDPFPAEK